MTFCACHRTEREYAYAGSVKEANDKVWTEAARLFEEFDRCKGGRACRLQSHYNRTTRRWSMEYDPRICVSSGVNCQRCKVLQRELSHKRGNVFFDVKEAWTVPGTGFVPDEMRTRVIKGVKLLEKPVSLTICEAIIKYARHRVMTDYQYRRRYGRPSSNGLRYELLNFRAAWMDMRDLDQDLQDVRCGIEVRHQADDIRASKEQTRQRRAAAKAKKAAKLEARILEEGYDLESYVLDKAVRLLGQARVHELLERRSAPPPVESVYEQTTFYL